MSKYSIIAIILAVLISWAALFFLGRSTVKCPEIILKSDSVVVKIDTVFLTKLVEIKETHDSINSVLKNLVEFTDTTILVKTTGIFSDTLTLNNDKVKGQIVHIVKYDKEKAVGLWDVIFKYAEQSITESTERIKEKLVLKEIPVNQPFYSDAWFWSWLITAGALLLSLIGAI